jgi:4-alpha-glucanotransferase
MSIGLYQDLAVGSLASSFDAWAFPGLFVEGVHLGAPSDAYSATGQDWGFPPLNPHRLRADHFRYWRLMLRSILDHCGMLRLDHAMGVLRQFWIPAGRSGTEGAYVAFPAEDLLGLLALESRARGAVVVAEDLGTVPKGFSALLARYRIQSSQVMFFERTPENGFVRSGGYSDRALLTAHTHDQATLAGWWNGRDIEIRRMVGMIAGEEEMAAALATRLRERDLLLRRLRTEGSLESTKGVFGAPEVTRAVYKYLSAAPSPLLSVSLDDLAFETEPVNVPGISVDEFPSWSRRMRAEISEIARSDESLEVLRSLGERARPRRRPR